MGMEIYAETDASNININISTSIQAINTNANIIDTNISTINFPHQIQFQRYHGGS